MSLLMRLPTRRGRKAEGLSTPNVKWLSSLTAATFRWNHVDSDNSHRNSTSPKRGYFQFRKCSTEEVPMKLLITARASDPRCSGALECDRVTARSA